MIHRRQSSRYDISWWYICTDNHHLLGNRSIACYWRIETCHLSLMFPMDKTGRMKVGCIMGQRNLCLWPMKANANREQNFPNLGNYARCSFAYSKKKRWVLGVSHQLQSVILVSFFSLCLKRDYRKKGKIGLMYRTSSWREQLSTLNDSLTIQKYCAFLPRMWKGNDM